ncbi:MAG: DUF3450 domain-containing protein [Gammaproteobacteria bacterium]|nr:DUF3450 domain-containing protein [Gammaproteobacteria bacterium]
MEYKYISLFSLSCFFLFFTNPVLSQKNINDVVKVQERQTLNSKSSQIRINKLSNQTQRMLEDYKLTLHKVDNLKAYNKHLSSLIKSQQDEMVRMKRQLGEIDDTQQNISPLMIRMVNTLDEFIKLDIPFHQYERSNRVAELQTLMSRADVSVSEKYRRVMEAYQIEVGYGKTIGAYQGKLTIHDKNITVEYLRIGRIGFYYQTLDGENLGYWDKKSNTWQVLPTEHEDYVVKALKVAKKHESPDLLMVPVQYSGVKL